MFQFHVCVAGEMALAKKTVGSSPYDDKACRQSGAGLGLAKLVLSIKPESRRHPAAVKRSPQKVLLIVSPDCPCHPLEASHRSGSGIVVIANVFTISKVNQLTGQLITIFRHISRPFKEPFQGFFWP